MDVAKAVQVRVLKGNVDLSLAGRYLETQLINKWKKMEWGEGAGDAPSKIARAREARLRGRAHVIEPKIFGASRTHKGTVTCHDTARRASLLI